MCLLLPLLENHPFTARVRPVHVTAAQHGHRRKHAADAVHMLRRFEEAAKAAPPEPSDWPSAQSTWAPLLGSHEGPANSEDAWSWGLLKAPQPAKTHGRLLQPA